MRRFQEGTPDNWNDVRNRFAFAQNAQYQRFGRWSKKGVWHAVFAELAKDADFEEAFIGQHHERFFLRIKHFRRIVTRYDKLAEWFSAFIAIVATFLWLA